MKNIQVLILITSLILHMVTSSKIPRNILLRALTRAKVMHLHTADLPQVVSLVDMDTARKDRQDILRREATHHTLNKPPIKEKRHHIIMAKRHLRGMQKHTLKLQVQRVKRVWGRHCWVLPEAVLLGISSEAERWALSAVHSSVLSAPMYLKTNTRSEYQKTSGLVIHIVISYLTHRFPRC